MKIDSKHRLDLPDCLHKRCGFPIKRRFDIIPVMVVRRSAFALVPVLYAVHIDEGNIMDAVPVQETGSHSAAVQQFPDYPLKDIIDGGLTGMMTATE